MAKKPAKRRRRRPPAVRIGDEVLRIAPLTAQGFMGISLGPERMARVHNLAMLLSARPPYKPVSVSAVVRQALDEYIPNMEATIALDLKKRRRRCSIVESRISDQGLTFCATCGYRWEGEPTSCPLDEE